jgi:histidinol-phosphate aminotransferase
MSWRDRLRPALADVVVPPPFDYTAAGPGLVRLDCNELPVAPGPDELRGWADHLGTLALNRYPEVDARTLREAFARRYGVTVAEVLVGNGSVELIGVLINAFGGAEPPALLYPDPSFVYYETIARTHGAVPLPLSLDDDFELDEHAANEVIDTQRPALAIFANPNNPTGKPFDLDVLVRLARRMDGVFVVDEAYGDYAGTSLIPRLRAVPGLFVLRTLSKLGYAGLRVGALFGPAEAIRELDKVRLPWNVNAISLSLATSVLTHPELLDAHVRMVVGWRRTLEAELRAIPGVMVWPSAASFTLVRVPVDAHAVHARMLRRGVLVKDLAHPGVLRNCLRITVGTPQENDRCVAALREAIAEP